MPGALSRCKNTLCGPPAFLLLGIVVSITGCIVIIASWEEMMHGLHRSSGSKSHAPAYIAVSVATVQLVALAYVTTLASECCRARRGCSCSCCGQWFGGVMLFFMGLATVASLLLLVVVTVLSALVVFFGAAVLVSTQLVDQVFRDLDQISDKLESELDGARPLMDQLNYTDGTDATDLVGADMMGGGAGMIVGSFLLTLGQFIVVLGFAAGYFGLSPKVATEADPKPSEESALLAKP